MRKSFATAFTSLILACFALLSLQSSAQAWPFPAGSGWHKSLPLARVQSVRFLSPDTWDPWLVGVETNRYAYAGNDPINGSDPNGHWFGFDDAIATGLGAFGGVADQAGFDAYNGELSSWGDYGAAAISGAAAGEASLYGGPVAGGIAAGIAHSVASSMLNDGELPSPEDVAISSVAGAVGGAIGAKIGTTAVSKLSKATKGKIGEMFAGTRATITGDVVIGRQREVALQGTGPKKTVVDLVTKNIFTGKKNFIESKFTMSPTARPSLTKAQRKANRTLPNYSVVQSTSKSVSKTSGTLGGQVGVQGTDSMRDAGAFGTRPDD